MGQKFDDLNHLRNALIPETYPGCHFLQDKYQDGICYKKKQPGLFQVKSEAIGSFQWNGHLVFMTFCSVFLFPESTKNIWLPYLCLSL